MTPIRISVVIIVLFSVLNTMNGEHTSAKCDFGDPSSRRECGWPGISRTQCEAKDCCYDSRTPGVKWCFQGQCEQYLMHGHLTEIVVKEQSTILF